MLSDPVRRARYDIEQRRQRRREWRAAWPVPPPQLQHTVPDLDLRGGAGGTAGPGGAAGAAGAGAHESAASPESRGDNQRRDDGAHESAPSPREARARLAEEKADWLARQLELMTRKLDAVQREKGALEQVRRRPTEQRRDRVAIEEERQAEA